MRPQALLVTSLVAVIALLGAALLRARRQISALRLNNAALLQATLPRSQTGIDEVPEVEASEPAPLSNKDNQTQLLTNLLAENAMLRQRLELIQRQASSVAANSNPPSATFAEPEVAKTHEASSPPPESSSLSREQIEAYLCANHIHQITLATSFWALDHDGFAPTNIVALSEYLAPMILVCPSAKPKSVAARDWSKFDLSTITYGFRLGMKWDFPNLRNAPNGLTYVWCPIHQTASFNRVGFIVISTKYVPP